MLKPDFSLPYSSVRTPVFGRSAIATSHNLASLAGMDIMERGGNAIDAAIAAAMVLTVVEPTGCGIGGDAFALVWDGRTLHGLNASGRSPAGWSPEYFQGLSEMPARGWDSVTVPGVVSGWVALNERFGKLSLEHIAEPAIRYARHGYAVTPYTADVWARDSLVLQKQPGFADCFMPNGRAPKVGEVFRSEAHAQTLEEIASTGGESFYRGALAQKIAGNAAEHGAALTLDDLAAHRAEWVEPISQPFAGHIVHELPPAGQGLATLIALGIMEAVGATGEGSDSVAETHLAIEAMKLALADLYTHVADPDAMRLSAHELLDSAYLARRAALIDPNRAGDPRHGDPRTGGTVCLSAADENGMMISFIQSNFKGFGSGVVVPDTGIALQNRGWGFTLEEGHVNQVGPCKRPFHTIIPGFVTNADGTAQMAFGLMGGAMQAQGHVQMALRILRHGQNPQAAADAPRWQVQAGRNVAFEPSTDPALLKGLEALGHDVYSGPLEAQFSYGGAQILLCTEDGYVGGSDPRKDGMALAR